MNDLFQSTRCYFTRLFRQTYLWVAMFATFGVMPLQAKPKNNIDKVDASQEAAAAKTASKKKPSKRKNCRKNPFVKEQMGELFRSTGQLCLSAGLVFGLHQLASKPFELSTLIAPLFSNLTSAPFKAMGYALSMLFFPSFSSPKLNEAVGLRKLYEARKHTFSPSIQSFTEQVLSYHIWAIQRFDHYSHKHANVIREVLQFPIGPKQVVPDTIAIHRFMRNYPEEVRLAIGAFVAAIVEDAKSSRLTKKSTPIMFVGPPGTGKTYLVKQLAALLQLPVQSIDLSKCKDVHGRSFYSSDPEKGVIADLLIGAPNQGPNWSNKIVVLDEIDKALAMDKNKNFVSKNGAEVYSFLHTFLEAQEVAMPLARYDHASSDISQMKIILIANKTFTETLTEDKAAALESRVKIIRFDQGFTPEKKLAIATAYVDQLIAKKGIDRATLSQDVIDAIMAEDARIGLKGVRVLLSVIDQYIDALKYQKLINEISGSTMAAFNVKQAYAPYAPKAVPPVQSNDTKLSHKKGLKK